MFIPLSLKRVSLSPLTRVTLKITNKQGNDGKIKKNVAL